jgi:hypothetical protein
MRMRRGEGRADDLVWSTTAFSFCLTRRKMDAALLFRRLLVGLFLGWWDLSRAVEFRELGNVNRVVGARRSLGEPFDDFAKSHIFKIVLEDLIDCNASNVQVLESPMTL